MFIKGNTIDWLLKLSYVIITRIEHKTKEWESMSDKYYIKKRTKWNSKKS